MQKRSRPSRKPPRRSALFDRSVRLHPHRRMPLLLLMLSLGVASVAIFQVQQSVRSHRAAAEGLLRDYAAFAAWSFRQHSVERMQLAFHQTLDPVLHDRHLDGSGNPLPVDVLWTRQRSDADSVCAAERPGAPYYFRIGPDGRTSFAGAAPPPEVQRWIATSVPRLAEGFNRQWEEALVSPVIEGRVRHIVYAVVGVKGQPRSTYGFELEPDRYQLALRAAFANKPLLPAALMDGRSNEELLAVRIAAPTGEVVYQSDATVPWTHSSVDTLPLSFGGLTVQATVRPEVAGSLVIGGLPGSRLPFLLGLLGLSVGLAVVAFGQLRRENQLARMRSDFVSSVSHELRTPLAQVRLFLETLRLGRYSTDAQREWLMDNLERETTRLTSLVDNVLHFSRAERGGLGGDREVVELGEYLEQVVDYFAPLAASRRVRLELSVEPDLAARLHRESFRQVMLNLLDNAVKYGPLGQRVRISGQAEGDRVRITVEDEGPGVDPAERERIWEPFRRGEHAIGSVAVGSGIGLAVVREIVEWHQGRAWVEAGERGGACFVLEVQREALPAPAAAPPRERLVAAG